MKKITPFLFLMGYVILGLAQAYAQEDPRVQKIYDQLQESLVWIKDDAWTPCGKKLLEALSHVEEEGLWAEDYLPIVKKLQTADLTSADGQKEADALLTLAALNYISDLKGNRLHPHLVDKDIFMQQTPIDETELLKTYLSSSDCAWIEALSPSSPDYQDLKALLAIYRQKQVQGGWPQLPPDTKLQKGDKGPLVKILKEQLIAQGTLSPTNQSGEVFDEEVEKAVKSYQDLHGLDQDGIVKHATLKALNTPVENRIGSILVSLERQRWLPNPLPPRYIQVNIPGFYLKAVGENVSFFMPIITGKEYRKTPVFMAPITEVIFNPAWHVPSSIVNEILPKIQSNPEAYARKGYHVFDEDGGVRIVQSPGSANSLGKIRFTVQSPFGVYLHGTPNQKLFSKTKRALSHGCIRVEDPYKLGVFVLNNPQKWPLDVIQKEASGTETKTVKLDTPLPVFISYVTVFEDVHHQWHFVEDEYNQDTKLWAALEKAKRNLGEAMTKPEEKDEAPKGLLSDI